VLNCSLAAAARFAYVLQCGPRFELKPYQIKLGTVDQAHVENEWVLRAYTRSTKKAKLAVEEEDD
jgi:U3 small nucleolar ribonucleoprotein protein IMP4